MKNVSVGNLVNFKKVFIKLLIIPFLALALLFSPYLDVYAQKVDFPEFSFNFDREAKAKEVSFGDDGELYGNPSYAELGNEELNLKINPSLSEIDLTKVADIEEKEFSQGDFPDVSVVADIASDEDLSKMEDHELMIEYTKKIRDLS